MKRLSPTAALAVALSLTGWFVAADSTARAQSATPADADVAPFDGVILLKNGGMVQGEISRTGDRWLIKNAGREMYVPNGNLDIVRHSVQEVYKAQQQRIARPTAETHLTLAEWCLRNELHSQAAHELAAARALDARHPRLALLDQRLSVAMTPPIPRPVAPPETTAAAPAPLPIASQPASSLPSMSDEVVERFTRRVQLVLVNNCTTSGCHQPGGAQTFQLDRALLHGLSNRRSTMSNLNAALAQVDHQRPQNSPLLTVPRAPHGGMDRPVLGPQQAKLVAQLIDWVALVTNTPVANEALATAAPTPDAFAPEPPGNVQLANYEERETLFPPSAGPRYGAQLRPWQPKDPFDPEIFNRRFHSGNNGAQ